METGVKDNAGKGKKKTKKKDAEESKAVAVIDEKEDQLSIQKELLSKVPQMFNEAQRALIFNETPRYKIKKRVGKGGATFDYVDVGYVVEQLNWLTGHLWDFDILWQTTIEEADKLKQFIVRGVLTVKNNEGKEIRKVQYGKCDIKEKKSGGYLDFGNDMKGAVSDCVKKCASWFGVALDVYSGGVQRRQDTMHEEAPISEGQRRRLEVLAQECNLGHSGLKKMINKKYDYTSTKDVQRRHFEDISRSLEELAVDAQIEDELPDDIKQMYDELNTPMGKRLTVYRSYKEQGKVDDLKKKLSSEIDVRNAEKDKTT